MSTFRQLMMRKKEEIMYATIKGTLTENDGVFSGFSSSNYLAIPNFPTYTQADKIEVVFNFTCSTLWQSVLCGGDGGFFVPYITSTEKIAYYGSAIGLTGATGSNTLVANQNYYFKAIYDTTSFNAYISTDGKNWILDYSKSVSATFSRSGIFELGNNSGNSSQYLRGSMNLNKSYIKINSTKYKLQAVVGYTVVGTLTESPSGVFSGFSSSNYLTVPKPTTIDRFELNIKFNFTSLSSYQYFFGDNLHNGIQLQKSEDDYIKIRYGNGNSSNNVNIFNNLSTNTEYIVNIKVEGTNAIVTYNIEGQAKTIQTFTLQYSPVFGSLDWILGKRRVNNEGGLVGSIDLNETYIKINNKLWFNGQEA